MTTCTNPDASWYHARARHALRMARAYRGRKMQIIYQDIAADSRECILDGMRTRQGWTLAERVAGHRAV